MADLAVGISKAAVEALVSKVQSAIKEEAEKWQTVQRDLVFITGEFEMMQSFLDTASEEHVKNKIVRTWVRQVRDLSNDVEDSIDFILHIDTAKRSWWLRLLPSCCKTGAPLPVDEAVAETTLLRARVVDVSQRNIRYNLISDDSGSKPVVQVQQKAAATLDLVIDSAKMQRACSDLVNMINAADENLQVISVCGRGGDHGKISIIKNAYEDSEVSENFRCRAWVKLTNSFIPHEIIQNFVSQLSFYINSCEEQGGTVAGVDMRKMMEVTRDDPNNEVMDQINNHRYLIIIEDISTMVQWHAIRSYLPDRKNGSRIVLCAQQLEIASLCTGQPYRILELSQLTPDNSVCIFFKEGLQNVTDYYFTKKDNDSLRNVQNLGRDTEVNELSQQIQERRHNFLYGMPGVGKSAIIRSICNQFMESNKFTKHAWINAHHPFNPTEFARSLLLNFYSKPVHGKDPIQECRSFLQEHNCLVVIDGLQSKEDWDWIKSNLTQHGHSGSCTIIITSDESVAKHGAVSSTDAVYNVKGLEPNAAHELFKKPFEEKGWDLSDNFMQEGDWELKHEDKLFLSKCGGLPRVLITVARYLASKPWNEFRQEMRRLSHNFMEELSTNPEFDCLQGLLEWMHSYLDSCPRHLKKCMLYLSIFPQDIIIMPRRLIRRWIAEGYSKGTDSISFEKHAQKIFDEIAALSILQPILDPTSKVIGYRVNGFFREYTISRPVEETIFFPLEVSALENKGHDRLTTYGIGHHLAIRSTWDDDRIVFEGLDFSRLRSLTLFNDMWFWSFYVSDRMRVLRVLDLENAGRINNAEFESIGKLPSRLKFLSLRGQSEISHLPDSVGDLLQLQTLDIRGTSIVRLPPFITKLRKMEYICAGTTVAWTDHDEGPTLQSSRRSRILASCFPIKSFFRGSETGGRYRRSTVGVEVPRGIKRLEALQTLGAICVHSTTDGEAILDEITGSLPRLMKLQVSGIGVKHGRRNFYALAKKTYLESLSLEFRSHFLEWQHLYIPGSLRSLKMIGPVKELPQNIDEAVNLGKLTLEMTNTMLRFHQKKTNTMLRAEVIRMLGRLPVLRILRLHLRWGRQQAVLQFPCDLFSKLLVLEIAFLSKLHVWFDERAMEKLEHLKFQSINGAEMQVSGLEHPASLKQVWLLGSFDDALKEAVQQQLVKHPKKPTLKLEVQTVD